LTGRELGKLGSCLDFYDELLIHDHVNALDPEFIAFIPDANPDLPRDLVPTREQLALERHYIKMLEKPKSKSVVNLVERPDHGSGKRFFNQFDACHAPELRRDANPKSPNPSTMIQNATAIDPPNPFNPPNPHNLPTWMPELGDSLSATVALQSSTWLVFRNRVYMREET
jgi:hypothetical protein